MCIHKTVKFTGLHKTLERATFGPQLGHSWLRLITVATGTVSASYKIDVHEPFYIPAVTVSPLEKALRWVL